MQWDGSDILFFFFFQPDYNINWEQIDSDAEFNVFATVPAIDHDSSFNITATEQIDSDTRFNIFSTISAIDHDTSVTIQVVSLSDTSYFTFSTISAIDHDASFNIVGQPIITVDHATLYRIRVDDEIAN